MVEVTIVEPGSVEVILGLTRGTKVGHQVRDAASISAEKIHTSSSRQRRVLRGPEGEGSAVRDSEVVSEWSGRHETG